MKEQQYENNFVRVETDLGPVDYVISSTSSETTISSGPHNPVYELVRNHPAELLLEAGYTSFLESIEAEQEVKDNTARRVIKALKEMTEYNKISNEEIAKKYGKTFATTNKDLIVVKDIKCYTLCQHHLLPFSLSVKIGVVPSGYALGLSKYARICQAVAKRLQMQEKYVEDVAAVLSHALHTSDIAVIVYDSKHTCACARGAQERDMTVTTSHMGGLFMHHLALREEFLRF
jgi:GTP cyclohydrolase I